MTVYSDKIWGIGGEPLGEAEASMPLSDAWYSEDGLTWSEALSGSGTESKALHQLGGRSRHDTVTFDGKLWLVGGLNGDFRSTSDVWRTDSGTRWTKIGGVTPFPTINGHRLVATSEKMWLLGGSSYDENGASVHANTKAWSTKDGKDWSTSGEVPWGTRQGLGAVVHDRQVMVLGGQRLDSTSFNDVWSLSDTVKLEKVAVANPVVPKATEARVIGATRSQSPQAEFVDDRLPPQLGASPIVFNGRLGLFANGMFWWTRDGSTWERVTIRPLSTPRDESQWRSAGNPIVHHGQVWLVSGGVYGVGSIWKSDDGTEFEAVALRSQWETFNS